MANAILWPEILISRFLVIENPGSIITGKTQMLKGGISEPRNKVIMKMFNLIRVGERAGSGVPDIFSTWENEGWIEPVIEEQYKPDRTILKYFLSDEQSQYIEKILFNTKRLSKLVGNILLLSKVDNQSIQAK